MFKWDVEWVVPIDLDYLQDNVLCVCINCKYGKLKVPAPSLSGKGRSCWEMRLLRLVREKQLRPWLSQLLPNHSVYTVRSLPEAQGQCIPKSGVWHLWLTFPLLQTFVMGLGDCLVEKRTCHPAGFNWVQPQKPNSRRREPGALVHAFNPQL